MVLELEARVCKGEGTITSLEFAIAAYERGYVSDYHNNGAGVGTEANAIRCGDGRPAPASRHLHKMHIYQHS